MAFVLSQNVYRLAPLSNLLSELVVVPFLSWIFSNDFHIKILF